MPPIDPRLIPQQPQGQTLAGPPPAVPPYYPEPSPQPFGQAMSLPPNTRLSTSRQDALLPSQADKGKTDAEIARLNLRKMRIEQGLDPDTGKTSPTKGLLGDDALKDLNPGEQASVKAIVQGRFPINSFSTRSPETMKLIERAMQYEPGTDLTTFTRRSVAFQKFMSNPNSPMLRVNQALQHLGLFAENVKKLNNFHSGITDPLNVGNYVRTGSQAISKDPQYEATATDRDALAAELAAAFQGSGQGGALADREEWKKRLSLANSPEGFDKVIREAVGLLGGRVEASNAQFKQAVGANAEFYDLMSPGAKKVFQQYSDNAPVDTGEDTGDKKLSTTEKAIPIPEGLQSEHAALLAKHPPGTLTIDDYKQIREKLDEEFKTELKGAHSRLDDPELKTFVDDYNKGAPINKIPAMNVPLGSVKDFTLSDPLNTKPLEQLHATVSESAPGVALENMGNAGSLGLVDLAAGKEGREALALNNADHPAAALVGEIAGSVGGMSALEKLGARGLKMVGGKLVKMSAKEIEDATVRTVARDAEATARQKLAGDVAVNTGYGSARGFNSADDGQGAHDALTGGLAGTAASVGGNALTKGITPFLSKGTQSAIKTLQDSGATRALAQKLRMVAPGINLTTLQKLGLGKVEAAVVPGTKATMLKRFNIDNSSRVLNRIGENLPEGMAPGVEINNYVNGRLNAAYEDIRPQIVGSVDDKFEKGIVAVKGLVTKSKQERDASAEIDHALSMFTDENGHYSGQGYKEAAAELRTLQKAWSSYEGGQEKVIGDRIARKAEQVRQQMYQLVERNTPGVGKKLKNLERAWKHQLIIEDASNAALRTGEGVYSPGHLITSTKKFETNKNMTARGKSFDQPYAMAAAKVMGAGGVPHGAIRNTAYVLGALGISAKAPAVAPWLAGAAGGLYGPGIKRIVQAALTGKRPNAVDNMLVRRALEDYMRHKETGEK